jgi:predicted Zn-dependent protease with MMP-like domain
MAVEMSFEKFEELVNRAIDKVPDELVGMIDNCMVVIEPEPPVDTPDLLGLYEGIPLTERNSAYSMILPDRIFIYMSTMLQMCDSYAAVVEQVRITVAHEIAHHFGISDATLHELGYG